MHGVEVQEIVSRVAHAAERLSTNHSTAHLNSRPLKAWNRSKTTLDHTIKQKKMEIKFEKKGRAKCTFLRVNTTTRIGISLSTIPPSQKKPPFSLSYRLNNEKGDFFPSASSLPHLDRGKNDDIRNNRIDTILTTAFWSCHCGFSSSRADPRFDQQQRWQCRDPRACAGQRP